jgi:hypothetical protein
MGTKIPSSGMEAMMNILPRNTAWQHTADIPELVQSICPVFYNRAR